MKTARLIVISLSLILVNCTEKGKPVIRHENDQRQQNPEQPATRQDPRTEVQALNTVDLDKLAARVLDEARIRDLRSYGNRSVQDELIALNEKIVRTPPAERSSLMPLLKNYVSRLQLECGEIKASCLGLKYFKMSAASSEVIKMIAQMPEFENQAGRLLLYALELKNALSDNTLLRLLIEKVPPTNAAVRSLLETALMSASESLRDPAKLREFLESVKAWELASNQKWMLGSGAQAALWSMIARARMMYDTKGQIRPELQALIQRQQSEPGSFNLEQKKLLETKAIVPEAMGAMPIAGFDELYFLTDAVFMQKLAPSTAAELFQHSRRSAQELASAVDNFARMRFVMSVAESNVAAKEIFGAAVPTETLLIHAMRQSSTVKRIWGTLNTRLDSVKGFASIALKQSQAGQELEPKLRATFNSFGRSVNLVAVYPHTLVLFQILSQKRFKIPLRGIGDVDSGALMPMVYHGSLPPLLDYSDEPSALNHFEIMHAFDMAVRSRMFNTMGIDPDYFMSDVLSRLNQLPITFIESTYDNVEKRMNETRLFRDFENICREFKGGPRVPRVIDLKGVRSSPYFGSVMDVLFTGMTSRGSRGGGSGALSESEMGIFYADGEYAEALERVRLDIQQYERVAQAMLTSYTSYLKKYEGASKETITKRTAKTRRQLEIMSHLRERTLQTATKYFEQVGWCYYKAGQKDYDMINAVIKMEEEHLRAVHRDMRQMRDPSISAEEKLKLATQHQFQGLPSNFKGMDQVDQNNYTLTSIDFLIRASRYIQKLAPNVSVSLGSRLDMDVEMVRTAEIRQIPYGENEQAFVDNALKAIFSKREPFAVWLVLAGGRVNMWNNLLKTMTTGYRLESEINGSAKTFSPQRIMEAHEDILRLTELTGDDRRLFNILRETLRFDPLYLDERLLKYTIDTERGKFSLQDIWSLFDLPVKFVNFEKLGYDYDQTHMGAEQIPMSLRPKRFGYLELGRIYYSARSSWTRGSPIIPYNADLDRELDTKVTNTVREGFRATKAFHKVALDYVAEVASRPTHLRPRADINIDKSITSLLSDNLIPSFDADAQQFRQATQGCFGSKCVDFK
jgi:hypothetical protein